MVLGVKNPQADADGASALRWALWVAGVVLVVWWACFQSPAVWVATGIGEAHRPFLDTYAWLAGRDALRQGINPYMPHFLDPYNRPFGYSEWWFALPSLGLGRKDTVWCGTLLLMATLVTAVTMAQPRTRREGLELALLLVSPAWLLAVNRANQDLIIFVVVSLGLVCFRNRSGIIQSLGVLLCAVAAVLKYFPLATLVLLLDFRNWRRVLGGFSLYVLVLLLAWPGLEQALLCASRYTPAPHWLYAFGAPVFLRNAGLSGLIGWLAPSCALFLWAAVTAVKSARRTFNDRSPEDAMAEREFACGAVLLVGAFFLGASYVYKLVFAIWLLPWLWRHRRDPAVGRWARATMGLLLAVVWFEGAVAVVLNLLVGPHSLPLATALLKGTLTVSQLLTWALVACLLHFLLAYIAQRGMSLLPLTNGDPPA